MNTLPVAQSNTVTKDITMKADSGPSKHSVTETDVTILKDVKHANNTTVVLPNKRQSNSNTADTLPLVESLRSSATLAYVLPGMTNNSLLSIGQLYHDDCLVIFDKRKLHVFKHKKLILQGDQNKWDGL